MRLQPKALGAKEGDVIELSLSYLPPGSSSNPTNVNVPTDGQLRPARWVLRFIINRVGFYLQAGAKLSLVWSQDYAPTAASFRGAQGVLVPGVGFDLMYYAGENMHVALRTLLFAFSGLSLRADYLDFDTGQSVEIGLGAHLNFFKGIVSFGVGYNFGIPNPRFTFREVYWSFGLGVEQMLDLAKTLADTYTR